MNIDDVKTFNGDQRDSSITVSRQLKNQHWGSQPHSKGPDEDDDDRRQGELVQRERIADRKHK